jgi:hypothetical protein
MQHPLAEVMLAQWQMMLPRGVAFGRQRVATQLLAQLTQAQLSAEQAINQLALQLESATIAR